MSLDKIIITNLPAFYKINLFNRIAEKCSIFLIFTGLDGEIRNENFYDSEMNFPYIFLKGGSKKEKFLEAFAVIKNKKPNKIIIGGWDNIIYLLIAFLFPIRKNQLIVESSYLESTTTGIKGLIKKIFLKRISKVFASGDNQEVLVRKLGFKGEVSKTGGVGIFDIAKQPTFIKKNEIKNFLYVGRFSEEKNLKFLINYFNQFPELSFSLVGYGPLENELKQISKSNIHFLGAINNKNLKEVYKQYDVFILGSTREPWGLVVEEALNCGLPILLSNKAGIISEYSDTDMIISFNPEDLKSFDSAVKNILTPAIYNKMAEKISHLDFEKKADQQTNVYI